MLETREKMKRLQEFIISGFVLTRVYCYSDYYTEGLIPISDVYVPIHNKHSSILYKIYTFIYIGGD